MTRLSDLKVKRKADRKLHREKRKLRKLEKSFLREKFKEEEPSVQHEEKEHGRDFTLSVAVPGSILDNAQSPDLRTYLAGQIARACVVFQVRG